MGEGSGLMMDAAVGTFAERTAAPADRIVFISGGRERGNAPTLTGGSVVPKSILLP